LTVGVVFCTYLKHDAMRYAVFHAFSIPGTNPASSSCVFVPECEAEEAGTHQIPVVDDEDEETLAAASICFVPRRNF
jgi:hypothetical protein